MSSRSNLIALLAVLAAAGYQNRDKIAEVLKSLQGHQPNSNDDRVTSPTNDQGGLGGILGRLANGGLGGLFGASSPGSILSNGLGGLLDHFRQNGLGDRADTWVKTGPNQGIQDHELTQALGDDVLQELAEKTGLSKDEIVKRLSNNLPRAVDDLTPNGSLPSEQELDMSDSLGKSSVPNAGGFA